MTCGVGVQLRKNILYDDRDSSDVSDAFQSTTDDMDLNSEVIEDCIDQDGTQKRNCYQPDCEGNIHILQILYHGYFEFILLTFSRAKLGLIQNIFDINKHLSVIYNIFTF